MVAGNVSSRRKPWPWDLHISGEGVLIKEDLVGRKQQFLDNVAPVVQEYSSQPVYKERTFPFRRLVLGMGERMQSSFTSRRYRYALGVDCSIGGMPRPGPLFTAITPAETGEIRDFVEALHNTTNTLFGLAGRYVKRRDGDTAADWVTSRDLGVGRTAWQGVRFKDANATPDDALYVGADNKDFWQYIGLTTTWTQIGSSAAIPAKCVTVLKDELWRGWDNQISKCTDDPSVAGNWASGIAVGDASSAITWMATAGGQLFVFKDNGKVFTVNSDGEAIELDPGVPLTPNAENGRAASTWYERLWAQLGDGFWSITPGTVAAFSPIGPERLLENDSEVRGRVTCSDGHQTYFLYEGLYNSQNGHSYLLKHGTWMAPESNEDAAYDFAEVPHGALKKWTSKRISSMRVSGIGGTNERLYCGFADGSVEWTPLPKGTPDPVADYLAGGECRFTADARELYWPLNHAMFQTEYKSYRGFSAFGPRLDSDNYVSQEYRTDLVAAYTVLTTNFISNGQRVDLDDTLDNVVGKLIDCKTVLVGIPVLEGMGLHHQVRPILQLEYTATVKAGDHQAKRDGSTDRKTADQIRQLMRTAAEAPGSVSLVMPDESAQGFSFIDYAESLVPSRERYGLAWEIPSRFIQYKTLTVYGTYEREAAFGTYEDIAAALTYEQLESL